MKSKTEFQIISWHSEDEILDDSSHRDQPVSKYNKKDYSKFVITIFGKDSDNKTYALKVEDFTPYFYIKVPDDFTKYKRNLLECWVRDEMQFKYK